LEQDHQAKSFLGHYTIFYVFATTIYPHKIANLLKMNPGRNEVCYNKKNKRVE